jgi:hypothetical protein
LASQKRQSSQNRSQRQSRVVESQRLLENKIILKKHLPVLYFCLGFRYTSFIELIKRGYIMRNSAIVRSLPRAQVFAYVLSYESIYNNHVSVTGYFSAEFFGSFGFDNVNWGFFYKDPHLNVTGLKKGEVALRYFTERMVAAGDRSFIVCVVNVEKGLMYFIKKESIETDTFQSRSDYESRGTKLKFLNVCEG